VAEAQAWFNVQVAFGRAAVELGVVHAPEHLAIDGAAAAHVKNTYYSAHGVMTS
jgi:hypothetical protein